MNELSSPVQVYLSVDTESAPVEKKNPSLTTVWRHARFYF